MLVEANIAANPKGAILFLLLPQLLKGKPWRSDQIEDSDTEIYKMYVFKTDPVSQSWYTLYFKLIPVYWLFMVSEENQVCLLSQAPDSGDFQPNCQVFVHGSRWISSVLAMWGYCYLREFPAKLQRFLQSELSQLGMSHRYHCIIPAY